MITTNTTVHDRINLAYWLHPKQLTGPAWTESDMFDMTGKPDAVVDQSGLSERYDFTFTFTPDAAQAALLGGDPTPATDNPDAAPDLFTALQQQLGLKLESTRAPVDVMVIDKVEKPSEN